LSDISYTLCPPVAVVPKKITGISRKEHLSCKTTATFAWYWCYNRDTKCLQSSIIYIWIKIYKAV